MRLHLNGMCVFAVFFLTRKLTKESNRAQIMNILLCGLRKDTFSYCMRVTMKFGHLTMGIFFSWSILTPATLAANNLSLITSKTTLKFTQPKQQHGQKKNKQMDAKQISFPADSLHFIFLSLAVDFYVSMSGIRDTISILLTSEK